MKAQESQTPDSRIASHREEPREASQLSVKITQCSRPGIPLDSSLSCRGKGRPVAAVESFVTVPQSCPKDIALWFRLFFFLAPRNASLWEPTGTASWNGDTGVGQVERTRQQELQLCQGNAGRGNGKRDVRVCCKTKFRISTTQNGAETPRVLTVLVQNPFFAALDAFGFGKRIQGVLEMKCEEGRTKAGTTLG